MQYFLTKNLLETSKALGDEPHHQKPLGQLLLDAGDIGPDDLIRALHIQRFEPAPLGEILVSAGALSKERLRAVLANQAGVPPAPSLFPQQAEELVQSLAMEEMIALRFVPFSQTENILSVALADLRNREQIEALFNQRGYRIRIFLASDDQVLSQITTSHAQALSDRAENIRPREQSARGLDFRLFLGCAILGWGLFAGAFFYLGIFPYFMLSIGVVVFLSLSALKFFALLAFVSTPSALRRSTSRAPLQKVSVLVPLYKEAEITKRLLRRLDNIVYPKELLEVFLICEADDTATQASLRSAALPKHVRMLVAPKGKIKTKPRAMNFALPFCSGDILCVYDAEDAPESEQVFKAVQHLGNAELRVACLQSRLDYYNQDRNWLARCFTLEYAILFRVFLPGLQRLDLPIPLGGTSMFIRRDVLQEIGAWDAHNVTEDADLGILLYRAGYRVQCLDSTTYEEANHRLRPWIKQRSRWLKGFLMTWGAMMRRPKALIADMGFRATVAMNIFFLGTVLSFLLVPFFIPLWLLFMGAMEPEGMGLTPAIGSILFFLLIFGEPYYFIAGLFGTRARYLRRLRWTLPSLIFYWPIGALAAYKAVYEVVINPFYWDKTEHGIDDAGREEVISALTKA